MLFHVMLGARCGFLKSSMRVVQIESKPPKPWHMVAYPGLYALDQILPWQTMRILIMGHLPFVGFPHYITPRRRMPQGFHDRTIGVICPPALPGGVAFTIGMW